MGTYWDAFVDEFPRHDRETDRAYLERFYSWLDAFSIPTKHAEHIADLMFQLAELNERYRREFSRTEAWHAKWTEQQVILAEAQAKIETTERDNAFLAEGRNQAFRERDAILAHAEAVREEAAKIAETAYPATRKGIAAAIRAMKVT